MYGSFSITKAEWGLVVEYRELSSSAYWSPLHVEVGDVLEVIDSKTAKEGKGILPQDPMCAVCVCLNDYDKVRWENNEDDIKPDFLFINAKIQTTTNIANHGAKARCEPELNPNNRDICWKTVCAIWNETWNILKSDKERNADGERKEGPVTLEGRFFSDTSGPEDGDADRYFDIFSFQRSPHKEPIPILTWANWGWDLRFETYGIVGQLYLPKNRDPSKAGHSLVFDIRPRFGDELYFHMLSRVLGRGELQSRMLRAHATEHGSLFFLALFWLAAFEKAYRNGLPRLYVERRDDRAALRGRLDIRRQLANHLAGRRMDRVSCHFRELSFDNVVSRTLRWCNRVLRSIFRGLNTQAMRQLARADQLLAAQGVPLTRVSPRELDRIHYTSMAEAYQPVMKLSQALLSAAPERSGGELKAGKTFLFSMTDLWEYYLLEVLNEQLGRFGCTVATANDDPVPQKKLLKSSSDGDNRDNGGELFGLRPDILIEKGGAPQAILDAKYKRVNRNAGINYGVEAGDVYQLTTYLTRYSDENPGGMKGGALVYPWPIPWAYHHKSEGEDAGWNHKPLLWDAQKKQWRLCYGDDDNDLWNFELIGFVLPIWAERFKVDEKAPFPWSRPLIFHDAVSSETAAVLGTEWVYYCDRHRKAPLEFSTGGDITPVLTCTTSEKGDGDWRRVPPSQPTRDLLDAIEESEKDFAQRIIKLIEEKDDGANS